MNNEVSPTSKHLVIYGFVLSWIHLVPEEWESLFNCLHLGLWNRISFISSNWIQSSGLQTKTGSG